MGRSNQTPAANPNQGEVRKSILLWGCLGIICHGTNVTYRGLMTRMYSYLIYDDAP
jgi:hypothetical protein